MRKLYFIIIINYLLLIITASSVSAQLKWQNVDSLYQPLPSSVHIYFTNQPVDTGLFRAYYLIADLKDKKLEFTADTSRNRRLTPSAFYERNDKPLVVVNCTFFSYETNRSLNVVIKDGKLVGYNIHSLPGKGKDTLTYRHPFGSAIGISKKRNADVAWLFTDSIHKTPYRLNFLYKPVADSVANPNMEYLVRNYVYPGPDPAHGRLENFSPWKMKTAVGGGPVLLQSGEIKITNNEELKFVGKAINDKHPRTAMGYTKDGKLIILVIEGRNKVAHGATLGQEAQIFKDLGCWEALNLDGGGNSCMLVNGKETIKVSDAVGQRPVPAVFIINNKK